MTIADTGLRDGVAQARERALAQHARSHDMAAYLLAAEPGHGQGGTAFAYGQEPRGGASASATPESAWQETLSTIRDAAIEMAGTVAPGFTVNRAQGSSAAAASQWPVVEPTGAQKVAQLVNLAAQQR